MSNDSSASGNRLTSSRVLVSLGMGLALTLAATAATWLGYFEVVERHMLDWRYQWFAQFNPPPSNRVIHIDIDDNALKNVGRWPWPRARLAQVVEELERAEAAVIGFDVLFDEPQEPRYLPIATTADGQPTVQRIDDDAVLAASLARANSALLAINLTDEPDVGPMTRRVLEALHDNPALTTAALAKQLNLDASQARFIDSSIARLKTTALRDRLFQLLDVDQPPDLAACQAALLPHIPEHVTRTPELDLLQREYERVRTTLALSRTYNPAPMNPNDSNDELTVPVPALAAATAGVGSVAYEADPDGRVRSVPLWLSYRGKWYPHFALAMVCQYLGVPISDLAIEDGATVIPAVAGPRGERPAIRLPMLERRAGDGWQRFASHRMLIPWQTNADHWSLLFARHGQAGAQHVPIGRMIELRDLRQDVATNRRQADLAWLKLMTDPAVSMAFPDELVAAYDKLFAQAPGTGDLPEAQRTSLLRQVDEILGFLTEQLRGAAELTAEEQTILDRINAAKRTRADALHQAEEGRRKITAFESELRAMLKDSICIIGWTATGALADFVPTSLEAKCPGPIVHGAIVSAMLTGHFIERGERWIDLLIVLMVGGVVTWIAARYSPISALIITVGFVVFYFLVNGMVLFDLYNTQVAAASPIGAAVLAWVAVTVFRLVAEQREKQRITRQFRNYVSPDLVDSLVDNPAMIKTGRHELTCMFSDIAGFTTVSEQLPAEQTIALLNRYLAALTDRAMDGHGYVNKYLGDGLMAVWGAPLDNARHALDCCRSALGCMASLRELNAAPDLKDLPNLHMRIGVATGLMMVGDCGAPPRRSDYTVIGDTVNLASRLEQSCKQFGTQMLMNSRTYELVREHMLARPIGRIVVVGRSQPEPVYELIASFDQATDEQRALAAATKAAVEAYYAADFNGAIELFEQLAERFGRIQLVDLYITACRQHLEQATTPEEHNGAIVLTTK